jgi:hypothetical protein
VLKLKLWQLYCKGFARHEKIDGTYNVKIRIYHKNAKYIDTSHFVSKKQLDSKIKLLPGETGNWNGDCIAGCMETTYQISLHIKTPSGFKTYGTFELGSDREQALAIFSELRGTAKIAQNSILYMDFSEIRDGIPLPIALIHCTLEDIAFNARIITRDVFKNLSL